MKSKFEVAKFVCIVILAITFTSCGTQNSFIVKKDCDTFQDSVTVNYFLKQDSNYLKKSFFYVTYTKENDRMKLLNVETNKIIVDSILKNSKGNLIPLAFLEELDINKDYLISINGEKHRLFSRDLKKFKFISFEYLYDKKKYLVTYTNDPKKYM
ncbi:hypothetical protein [Flavobacterium sp.]|uniref:hypothetical protein n=1 Tax=Flavobacterium sp. TaxID=239 RepID=UPI0039E39BC4